MLLKINTAKKLVNLLCFKFRIKATTYNLTTYALTVFFT